MLSFHLLRNSIAHLLRNSCATNAEEQKKRCTARSGSVCNQSSRLKNAYNLFMQHLSNVAVVLVSVVLVTVFFLVNLNSVQATSSAVRPAKFRAFVQRHLSLER